MATTYKTFTAEDIENTTTLLHENIPITGTIVSGTYDDNNIQTFTHGRFQSVYDYPYLSSSANHIFDISVGLSSDSILSGSTANHIQMKEKIQMYNQMAQTLVGYDIDGSILKFDRDGNILGGGDKLKECVFLSFSRLLAKDEIKKESVSLQIGTGSFGYDQESFSGTLKTISDYGATNEFRINSPAGEYGILYDNPAATEGTGVGLVFYQAGVMVLTSSVFDSDVFNSGSQTVPDSLSGSLVDATCDAVRNRIYNISFNNTVELNSSIYFCRINQNDFNYSSNPTYLAESKIVVKENQADQPISYITTVGLYSSNNELLAVAKLSEPLKKTPQTSLVLRTRLDF